jgi:hypothetical protein
MNHKEIGCDNDDWIHVVRDEVQWRAVMNRVMNLWVL